eukprot:SM000102S09208  [mRNA]  locus=s102:231854:235360:- [translate_table: standard]
MAAAPPEAGGSPSHQPPPLGGRRLAKKACDGRGKYKYGNYASYYGYRVGGDMELDPRVEFVRSEWVTGKACLDIGCNVGSLTVAIAERLEAASMLGIDIDHSLVNRARSNLRKAASGQRHAQSGQLAQDPAREEYGAARASYSLASDSGDKVAETGAQWHKAGARVPQVEVELLSDRQYEGLVVLEEAAGQDKESGRADSELVHEQSDAKRARVAHTGNLGDGRAGSPPCSCPSDEAHTSVHRGEGLLMKCVQSGHWSEKANCSQDQALATSYELYRAGVGESKEPSPSSDNAGEAEGLEVRAGSERARGCCEADNVTKETRKASCESGASCSDQAVEGSRVLRLSSIEFLTVNFLENRFADRSFDTVLCFSVTKWIHLNWGDAGIIHFFAEIFRILRLNGVLVLEPQLWRSYEKKRDVSEVAKRNFEEIKIKPDDFPELLLDRIGFRSMEEVRGRHSASARGFDRPIYAYYK